jgi:hypothetical protein
VTALLAAAKEVIADRETYCRLNARVLQLLPPPGERADIEIDGQL